MSAKRIPQSVARAQREEENTLQSWRTVAYFSMAILSLVVLLWLDRCIKSPLLMSLFRVGIRWLTGGFALLTGLTGVAFFARRADASASAKVLQPWVAFRPSRFTPSAPTRSKLSPPRKSAP